MERVVEKEVIKEVPVENVVEREVIKEVPVEKSKEERAGWPKIFIASGRSPGSVTYIEVAGVAQLMEKYMGVQTKVEAVARDSTALRLIQDEEAHLRSAGLSTAYIAARGKTEGMKGVPVWPADRASCPVNLLWGSSEFFLSVTARPGAGINSPADLVGKKWACGTGGTPLAEHAFLLLEELLLYL